MSPAILLAALLLGAAEANTPVELAPGQIYSAGTTTSVPSLGLTFTIPSGWTGGMTPTGEQLQLTREPAPGMIMATAEAGPTLDQILVELGEPVPLDAFHVMQPTGTPTRSEDWVEGFYSLSLADGSNWVGGATSVVRHGVAVGFFAMLPKSEEASLKPLLKSLRDATQLRKVEAPKPGARTGPWANQLPGMSLVYMNSDSGFYEKREFHLCSSGEVLYRDESGGFSSGGGSSFSAAGNARDRGQWWVQGSQLQMRWGDGSSTTLQLSRDGEKTLVNGTRYFLVDSERCD